MGICLPAPALDLAPVASWPILGATGRLNFKLFAASMAQWAARVDPFSFLLYANANILCWMHMRHESKCLYNCFKKNLSLQAEIRFVPFVLPLSFLIFLFWSQELLISHVVIPKFFSHILIPREVRNKFLIQDDSWR
jgi:hypothetical protein